MNPASLLSTGLILIVDDQRNWREALGEMLQADGHQVQTAASLTEARMRLEEEDFDVAIVDIRLLDERDHDIQGLELLQEIRKTGLRARVIVLTGYAPPGTRSRVHEIGAQVLAFKGPPQGLDIAEFRGIIRELVQEAQTMCP